MFIKSTYLHPCFSLGTSSVIELSVSSVSHTETKDSILLTEFSKYYRGICENATDVVTDTSDDLFFLNGELFLLIAKVRNIVKIFIF